jgi:hypothetical protein
MQRSCVVKLHKEKQEVVTDAATTRRVREDSSVVFTEVVMKEKYCRQDRGRVTQNSIF